MLIQLVEDEIYKAGKSSSNADVTTNGRNTAEDEEDQDDDVAAGPEMPPEDEDGLPNDEDGRFFGGGVTKDTAEVLDFIEERDKEDGVRNSLYTICSTEY